MHALKLIVICSVRRCNSTAWECHSHYYCLERAQLALQTSFFPLLLWETYMLFFISFLSALPILNVTIPHAWEHFQFLNTQHTQSSDSVFKKKHNQNQNHSLNETKTKQSSQTPKFQSCPSTTRPVKVFISQFSSLSLLDRTSLLCSTSHNHLLPSVATFHSIRSTGSSSPSVWRKTSEETWRLLGAEGVQVWFCSQLLSMQVPAQQAKAVIQSRAEGSLLNCSYCLPFWWGQHGG